MTLQRKNILSAILRKSRVVSLRKIAVDMDIALDEKEEKIFSLLKSVVRDKTPDTVLRVAGGWVRDKLLGKQSHDIDIAVNNMTGEQFANIVADYMKEHGLKNKGVTVVKANPDQSKHLATAILNIFGVSIDFVNLRKEEYSDSRIPTMEAGTPEEDASRRDLTINSLFYNVNEDKVEDFVGGLEDLKKGIARTPIDPVQTFIDDPLRILRTIRFASKYNLDLAPEIIDAAKDPRVLDAFKNKVSKERVWKELAGQQEEGGSWKAGFMSGPNPARAAKLLEQLGLRDVLFGLSDKEMEELGLEKGMTSFDVDQNNPHHDLSIWEHTLSVLEHLSTEETTEAEKVAGEEFIVKTLSALLHDIGKCDLCSRQESEEGHYTYHGHDASSAKIAEYVLKRLKAPNSVIDRVVRLVQHHMRLHTLPSDVKDNVLRRFVRDLEKDWKYSVDLAIADAYGKTKAKGDESVREKYDEFAVRIDNIIKQMGGGTKPKPPISGKDLIDLGFKQGPRIGKALKALSEKLLENPTMTKEEAIEYIQSLNI